MASYQAPEQLIDQINWWNLIKRKRINIDFKVIRFRNGRCLKRDAVLFANLAMLAMPSLAESALWSEHGPN